MLKRKMPPRLWDYGLVYETNILNRFHAGSSIALGLKLSLANHLEDSSGSTLNSTIGCGIPTRRRLRLMAAGVTSQDGLVSHTKSGVTYVTGCYSSMAK